MKSFINILNLSLLSLSLIACGSSGGNSKTLSSIQLENYEIVSYDITGTSTDIETNIAPINSGINNGQFSVSWLLGNNTEPYTAKLYFSTNNTLSNGDIEFYSLSCQNSLLMCARQITFNDDCTFNTSNIISCSERPTDAQDLTASLPTLPFDGFILLDVCEFGSLENCDIPQAHAVRFE